MSDELLDLLIVGAGPAGLLASAIASRIGITNRVVERRTGLHTEPSAHVLKTHSMEVYRRIGAADAIIAPSTPIHLQRCITWCESVGGLTYGRLSLEGMKGAVPRFTEISPVHSVNLPQNVLEPILHARAKAEAGADPVSFGTAFDYLEQDDDGVTIRLSSSSGPETVRARFVFGADGAGSRVRRNVGIEMEGPQALAHFLAIHIRSDVRPFLERNPGVLFFIRTPTLEGFFIMHEAIGSQVLMLRYDPEITPFDTFDTERAGAIIDEAFGCAHDFEIAAIDRWAMSAQVARSYRVGRVLLVGDAAHRFPPTGGLGLNTGVEDIENAIWKVAAVIRGQAAPALLDSYETECRPVALRNTRQSVGNHEGMHEVVRALRADGDPAVFRRSIEDLRGNADHPRFAEIQSAIDAQVLHFAFLGLEMAATADVGLFIGTDRPIATPVPPREGYQPSFAPGAHIPHLWLAPDRSTIDVLSFDRMTLFVAPDAVERWRRAADDVPPHLMPVTVVALPRSARTERITASDFWGATPFAILVRPDGRIAWVEPVDCSDPGAALATAMTALFDAPSSITNGGAAR